MGIRALLLIAAAGGGGFQLWQMHERSLTERHLHAAADVNGFVPILASDDAPRDTVVILAAINCPKAPAQRAAALEKELARRDIPVLRANTYQVTHFTREQMRLVNQTQAVLAGEIPIVVINGRARANPGVDDVAVEFRSGR